MNQTGRYRHHKYKWSKPFGNVKHWWEFVTPVGALHFQITIVPGYEPSAGLEFHHIAGEGAPDHVDCPLTGGRCWHDGTSLYATDTLWPLIEAYLRNGDHETIFRILEGEADRHFGYANEPDPTGIMAMHDQTVAMLKGGAS